MIELHVSEVLLLLAPLLSRTNGAFKHVKQRIYCSGKDSLKCEAERKLLNSFSCYFYKNLHQTNIINLGVLLDAGSTFSYIRMSCRMLLKEEFIILTDYPRCWQIPYLWLHSMVSDPYTNHIPNHNSITYGKPDINRLSIIGRFDNGQHVILMPGFLTRTLH
jgi:hypothetical protein